MKLKNVNRVIDKFEKDLETKVKANLKAKSNTGKLKSSFDVVKEVSENRIRVIIDMEHYGEWVDKGRKPGKGIPVNVLQKWIKSRNLVLQDTSGKDLPMTPSRLDSLSYVINKKIREKGIEPTFFLTEPLDVLLPKFTNDLTEAFADDSVNFLFE